MDHQEIELKSVDFITIGTIGPKGKREFYLQAGGQGRVVSLLIEKAQARAISETLTELLDDLLKRAGNLLPGDHIDMSKLSMDLRDPVEPLFRVGQIGLSYSVERDMILIELHELINLNTLTQEQADDDDDTNEEEHSIVRLWVTRPQMRALSIHAMFVVRQGRVDPQSNGRMLYYWI